MKKAGLDRQDRVDKPKIEKKYAQWEKRDNSNSANENQKKNLNKNSELIPELVQNILNLGESDLGKLFQIMGMVSEGGAAGHMPHPYEDKSLTFADMRELIRRGTSGGLDAEAPVSEKIDGANINFSYRDGKILFARSKGQFKNRGANALDRDALFSKYEGSERAQAFFTRAADELSKSIGDLSTDEISSMFGNGSTWVNVEIVGSDSKNVIPYNKNVLVFHNSVTFDEEGTPQSTDMNAGHVLAKKITQSHQSDPGATYGVQGPQIVAFSDKDDSKYLEYQKEFNEAVNLIQKTSGMSDDSTIGDMLAKKWQGFIKKILPEGANMSPEMVSALGRRWGAGEKTGGSGIGAREFKKAHPELTDWFASTEKISHTVNKKMIRPIELLYLKLGAVSLMRVSNFMESNNPSASAEIKEGIVQVLKAMREAPGQASDEMVAEMDRLESVGFDKLVPSEGVVFTYKGNLYKFTGSFAPLNQLLGAFRYKPEQLGLPPRPVDGGMGGESIPKPIVIYPGRFQPFHPGHKSLYDKLVDAYGEENVYIATSNKMDNKESPLSFEEKKTIMTKLFGINPNNIVQTTSPYTPSEILQNISPDTPVIMAVSSKDSDKISRSGFFKRLPPNPTDIRGHGVARYYDVLPELHQDIDSGANMSGSSIRSALANPNLDSIEKKKAFQNIFGKYDPEIFSIMANGFGRLKTSSVPQLTSRRPSDTEAPPIAPKRARPKATGPLRLRKKSEPAMEEPPPQQDRPEPISTSSRLAAAPRKPRQPDAGNEGEEDFLRSLGIDPKARVKNPETDNDILITTALGYDKNHPARKNADTYIRAHSKK